MNVRVVDSIKLGSLMLHVDPVLVFNRMKYPESISILLSFFSFLLLFFSYHSIVIFFGNKGGICLL